MTLTREELWELVFRVAGVATAPLLEENPGYLCPSERVAQAVGELLIEEGYGPPPHGYTVRSPEVVE